MTISEEPTKLLLGRSWEATPITPAAFVQSDLEQRVRLSIAAGIRVTSRKPAANTFSGKGREGFARARCAF